jgi:ribonuclease HI
MIEIEMCYYNSKTNSFSWIHGKCSSNEGEALALLEAMKELQQRGFANFIFESSKHSVCDSLAEYRCIRI